MENQILIYCLKVSVALALFYLLYKLCMTGDTFLKIRRIYLLSALIISIVYPFISMDTPELIAGNQSLQRMATPEVVVNYVANSYQGHTSPFRIMDILFIMMAIGSAFFGLQLSYHLGMVVALFRGNSVTRRDGCYLIEVNNKGFSPFSFFNLIFVDVKTEGEVQQRIIAHETIHAKQHHSLDILLMEIVCILFWWNPFVWLLKREMKINLEYLADQGVIAEGYDKKHYQYTLLHSTTKNTGISIINNFNVSQLKKRISMMNKKRSPLIFSAKYLLVLPLLGLLLIGSNVNASTMGKEKSPSSPHSIEGTPPSFRGGEDAMNKFIMSNLRYPEQAQLAGVEGRVFVAFTITANGKVTDIKIDRGLDAECDAEVIRMMKTMPDWIPSVHNGKSVDSTCRMAIAFKLKGAPEKK